MLSRRRSTSARRWVRATTAVMATVCVGTLAACGGSAAEEEDGAVTLRLADPFPPNHYISEDATTVFMEEAGQESGGTLKFDHFPSGQLGNSADMLEVAKSGTADIAYLGIAYHGDTLPLSDAGALPNSASSGEAATLAYWDLVSNHLDELEFEPNGVEPLFSIGTPPYNLVLGDKKVHDLEDVHGQKMRTGGGTLSLVGDAIGVAPVEIAGAEQYTAMQRGTLDGTMSLWASMPAYSMEEVIAGGTTNLDLGGFVAVFAINEETFAELTPTQQEALRTAGQEAMDNYGPAVDELEQETIEEYEDLGLDMYEVDGEAVEDFERAADSAKQRWAERLDSDGLPGTETLEAWDEAVHRAERRTDRME